MSALEEERDFLLRSLDDLEREREAGDLDDADYATLKDDYTARAAGVLRALAAEPTFGGEKGRNRDVFTAKTAGDRGDAAGADSGGEKGRNPDADAAEVPAAGVDGHGGPQARRQAQRPPPGGATGGRRWRPVVVGVVLLAFASAAGMLVARSAGERLPGEAATGAIAPTGPAAAVAADLAEARDLIGQGRTLDAIKVFDRVLEQDPDQPEALAYRGWLLRLAGRAAGDTGLIDKGMEYIERAVAADPGYPDARFFRAFVNYQDRRDPAAAVPDLRAYLAGDAPAEMLPVVEDLLRRALADVDAGAPSPVPVPATPSSSLPPG